MSDSGGEKIPFGKIYDDTENIEDIFDSCSDGFEQHEDLPDLLDGILKESINRFMIGNVI